MTRLQAAARACLDAATCDDKLARTFAAADAFARGGLAAGAGAHAAPDPIAMPGRPPRPRLVHPRALPRRGFGTPLGLAAFVHAVAHIEFNAIDLAWDAVYRFGGMPAAYYADWVAVARDEARHFVLLRDRLRALGHDYGSFDAHNGLWEMAERTAHGALERMALVPRVLEARGLDVTPGMIARLRALGDGDTVAILELILREEIAHVAAGSRWFAWCCRREGVEPRATFRALLRQHAGGVLHGPFNRDARLQAGFDEDELLCLQAAADAA